MIREILLGTTILTNYARAVYAASNPTTYQLGPAAHGDFADDRIAQASIGGTGTVSSEGLTRVAQLPWSPVTATPVTGAGCDTTPIILTTPLAGSGTAGTWTAIAGCGHVSMQAFGPGGIPVSANGTGAKGGGYGAVNEVSVVPGNQYGYSIGAGSGSGNGKDTFFCNDVPANCQHYYDAAVVALGAAGSAANANVGSTTFTGGTGGVWDSTHRWAGGGGGGAGPNGNGANGGNGVYAVAGGAGGQGDNATGGTGGAGGLLYASPGGNGGAGVEIGGAHGAGGGGGGSYGYPGNGGQWGGAVGGDRGSGLGGATAGQGGIILTPAP